MKKEKIFVSAYACEPYKGSEIGVGWNWVLQMSKDYELWVLTRSNNREIIEDYFHSHPEDDRGIHFVYYDLPEWILRHKKQMKGIYIYYPLWMHGARKISNAVIKENHIHIYHQLTYGNALWGVNPIVKEMIFIWGPIGGLEVISQEYRKHYSIRSRLKEMGRHMMVRMISFSPGFHFRCKHADLILCKTKATYSYILEKYRNKALLCTDVAADVQRRDDTSEQGRIRETKQNRECVSFLAVGRLDAWRGFDLLIEAFHKASKENENIRLHILGEGIERERLMKQILNLHMQDVIKLPGAVSMETYQQKMMETDVVINVCLKEGGVTTAFDCMVYGKPLICLDTGGYTENFDEDCAVIVPVANRENTINEISRAILKMCQSSQRKQYAVHMRDKAQNMSWNRKGEKINAIIQGLIKPPEDTMDLTPEVRGGG